MVVYLEKTEGNAEFHEIIDFLMRSSIHHALTVSPVVSTSEVPIEQQTGLSPRPSPTPIIPDSIPETSGENLGGHSSSDKSLSGNEGDMTLQSVYDLCLSLCAQVSDQAKEIQLLKAQITKLKKQAKPVIKHHISIDMEKVSTDRPIVSTDGSKVSTDRQKEGTDEGTEEHIEGTEEQKEGTEEQKEGIDEHIKGTEEQFESTDWQRKGTEDHTEEEITAQTTQTPTQTPTSTMFGDDETIAKVLLNMSQ
ncbi:hypothetical protein Tco_0034533, partial [Tanacetum coccineum]